MRLKEEFAKLGNEVREIVSIVKNQATVWKNTVDAQVKRLEDWKNEFINNINDGSSLKSFSFGGDTEWHTIGRIGENASIRLQSNHNFHPEQYTVVFSSYSFNGSIVAPVVSHFGYDYTYSKLNWRTIDDNGKRMLQIQGEQPAEKNIVILDCYNIDLLQGEF
jgi:hypothetical protein